MKGNGLLALSLLLALSPAPGLCGGGLKAELSDQALYAAAQLGDGLDAAVLAAGDSELLAALEDGFFDAGAPACADADVLLRAREALSQAGLEVPPCRYVQHFDESPHAEEESWTCAFGRVDGAGDRRTPVTECELTLFGPELKLAYLLAASAEGAAEAAGADAGPATLEAAKPYLERALSFAQGPMGIDAQANALATLRGGILCTEAGGRLLSVDVSYSEDGEQRIARVYVDLDTLDVPGAWRLRPEDPAA